MKREERAWLASCIDFEGSIFIFHNKKRDCYLPEINVSQTSYVLDAEIKRLLYESDIYYLSGIRLKGKNKPQFYVKITRPEYIIKFIELIEKFLLLKKRQACAIKEFCKYRLRIKNKTRNEKDKEYEKTVYKKMKIYNRHVKMALKKLSKPRLSVRRLPSGLCKHDFQLLGEIASEWFVKKAKGKYLYFVCKKCGFAKLEKNGDKLRKI